MGFCCMSQGTQTGPLYQPRGVGWGERWEGVSKGRRYMYTMTDSCQGLTENSQNSIKQLSSIKK